MHLSYSRVKSSCFQDLVVPRNKSYVLAHAHKILSSGLRPMQHSSDLSRHPYIARLSFAIQNKPARFKKMYLIMDNRVSSV